MTELTTAVEDAVATVRDHFAGQLVGVVPDGTGGAFVTVSDVHIGDRYTQDRTWLGFQVNAAYPQSDVYPHYIGNVARRDGHRHGEAIQDVTWQGREALQLSRRSTRWNPAVDNAALKAEKVITWFASR